MAPGRGGHAGMVGEVPIEDVTEPMIQRRLAGIAKQIF